MENFIGMTIWIVAIWGIWGIWASVLIECSSFIDKELDEDYKQRPIVAGLFPIILILGMIFLPKYIHLYDRDEAVDEWNKILAKWKISYNFTNHYKIESMLQEGPKIYVESLFSEEEHLAYHKKYPGICHKKTRVPFFNSDFNWRHNMGATLSPAQIKLINSRLDALIAEAGLKVEV